MAIALCTAQRMATVFDASSASMTHFNAAGYMAATLLCLLLQALPWRRARWCACRARRSACRRMWRPRSCVYNASIAMAQGAVVCVSGAAQRMPQDVAAAPLCLLLQALLWHRARWCTCWARHQRMPQDMAATFLRLLMQDVHFGAGRGGVRVGRGAAHAAGRGGCICVSTGKSQFSGVQGAVVCVSGAAQRMPQDVAATFQAVAAEQGGLAPADAARYVRQLALSQRYFVEAWS